MIDTTPMYAKLWGSSRVRHSLTPKHLSQDAALDLLRKPGHLLGKNRPRLLHRPRRLGDGNSRAQNSRAAGRAAARQRIAGRPRPIVAAGTCARREAPQRNSSARRVSAPAAVLPANREDVQMKSSAKRKIPTAAEVLARQKADHMPGGIAAKSSGTAVVAAKKSSPAVAANDQRNSVQRYLDEVAPASIVGRMIKFGKEGQFVTHDDGEPIAADAEFVALCDQTWSAGSSSTATASRPTASWASCPTAL